jgi:ElaB/YqjD/DUF883 family membrane-anchored ribosome-binding protein
MSFLRRKSLTEELIGQATQLAHRVHSRDAYDTARDYAGTAREYAGRAGSLASQVIATTGRQVRRRPGLTIAIGAGIGLGAIATAWLLARRHARIEDDYDEHDPTRYRATNDSGDALDGTGEDNPVPGETGIY